MPQVELTANEIDGVLAAQRIVRVAFSDGESGYLIPLGYRWQDGCLCLTLTRGRKTQVAERNARVAFQVDDTAERGVIGWSSITGEGEMEFVEDPQAAREIASAVGERFPELAGAREASAKGAAGEMVVARIRPTVLSGRRFTGFGT